MAGKCRASCVIPATVVLLALAVPVLAAPLKIVKSASADLNGDGKTEIISISIDKGNRNSYVLRVGKIQTKGSLALVDGFAIVDIDNSDKRKEIAVHTDGPSDNTAYHIYTCDGKQLKVIGQIHGDVTILGNGMILVDYWTGSWSQRDKFVLDKATGKLKLVPQELQWVNETVVVRKSFLIYQSRGSSSVVANLRPQSKILLVAVDFADYGDNEKTWLLIKSESNLLGWAQLKALYDHTDILRVP